MTMQPWRNNILLLAFMIVLVAVGAGVLAHYSDMDDTMIMAILTAIVSPLAMMAKELLTEPEPKPPPSVPADVVMAIIAKIPDYEVPEHIEDAPHIHEKQHNPPD